MAFLQCVCCIISDINEHKQGKSLKLITVTKWMIPIMCAVIYTVTLGYALGWNIDIRKFACTIVGVLFVVTGNYLPKLNYVKSVKVDSEKARKINRFVGYETVVLGLLMLFSIFFPPFVSVVCLILLIPYTIIGVVYGIVVGRK
jgi:hypothetical protein